MYFDEKINLDETVREIGDWRDSKVVLEAGKIVVNRIDKYLNEEISFSQETTLCGRSIFQTITKVKELGYKIEMHYIGLEDADIAKARVKNRVMHGGHGISDIDIEKRYLETLNNLKKILPLCNLAAIYDNSDELRRIAIYQNGRCVRLSGRVPIWFKKVIEEK